MLGFRRPTTVGGWISLILGFLFFTSAVAACASSSAGSPVQNPPIPRLTVGNSGWVDTTGKVPASTMQQLRQIALGIDQAGQRDGKGYQVAGVIFNDIASDPSTFASDVGNANGIGSGKNNNGLLIMVLLNRQGSDGHKPYIFVATGRGLEGDLPDSKVSDFRSHFFDPLRAKGQWQQGLISLESGFGQFLEGHNPIPPGPGWPIWAVILLWGVIIIVVLFFVLLAGPTHGGSGSVGRVSVWGSGSSGSSPIGGGGSFGGGGSGG